MICTYFIIALSFTLIFCLSLLFWMLKIASPLVFFVRFFFFVMDVGNHIVLDFNSLFVSVGMSVRDHFVLLFSFFFILIDVGNRIALDIDLLFAFVLGTSKWRKKIVCILSISIIYYTILKNSVTHLSNSCDSKTRFTSFQISFLSARTMNPLSSE